MKLVCDKKNEILAKCVISETVQALHDNLQIQLREFEVGRSAIYAMKLGYLILTFHTLIMPLFPLRAGSKQILMRPF